MQPSSVQEQAGEQAGYAGAREQIGGNEGVLFDEGIGVGNAVELVEKDGQIGQQQGHGHHRESRPRGIDFHRQTGQ